MPAGSSIFNTLSRSSPAKPGNHQFVYNSYFHACFLFSCLFLNFVRRETDIKVITYDV